MSIWNIFDGGISRPVPPKRLHQRLFYRFGRYLARRHKNVYLPDSCLIHPGAKINPRNGSIRFGENCVIGDGAIIQGNVEFGDDCSVQPYTLIVGYGTSEDRSGQITIGNGVRIAAHGMMIAANHNFSNPEKPIHGQGMTFEPITLEDDIWIGGRVNITAGVSIGYGSVIGAGSVVTRDIPPMSIAAGVPAKVIRQRG